MKFCTYDDRRAGVVAEGKVYPVGAAMVAAGILKDGYTMVQVIEAMTGNPDAPACVDECIRSGDATPLDQVTLRAPIDNPTSLWAAAANYMDHRKEMETRMGGGHQELPDKDDHMSQDFLKPVSSIIGPGGTVIIPKVSHDVDFECELCVVIGKTARKVTEDQALDYVFGYTICWDISQRDPWGRGKQNTRNIRKGFDTFSPQGPWIVTKDEIPEPQDLSLRRVAQRRAGDDRPHQRHDLRRPGPHPLPVERGDPPARRPHHHRHAGRRPHAAGRRQAPWRDREDRRDGAERQGGSLRTRKKRRYS